MWMNSYSVGWAARMVHTSQLVLRAVVEGQMGWAAIVHNEAGGFVRCISGSMKSSPNLFMTETLAVRFGWCYYGNRQ